MLSDRSYMRRAPGEPPPGFLAWFLGVIGAIFLLHTVLTIWFGTTILQQFAVLSGGNLRAGRFWTVLSYAFFHGSALHLLLNGYSAYVLLRSLSGTLSTGRLITLTVASALGGAAFWIGLHFNHYGHVAGASAVLMGYLTVLVCRAPREPIFLIPVARYWILVVFVGVDLLGLVAWELPRGLVDHSMAHSAHLGGVAAGWLFHRLVLSARRPQVKSSIEPPSWLKKRATRSTSAYTVNLDVRDPGPDLDTPASGQSGSRDALKAEVDRILDKINLHGFGSLTAAEKRALDEARQQLSHR